MNRVMLNAALTAAALAAIGLAATPSFAGKPGFEKCGGIAKAGKNDCATASHSCAGTASADGQKADWVYAAAGTCDKIVGGILIEPAPKS